VRVKTQYFEKLKTNISTGRIQTKFSTRKRLNTRSILLLWLVANCEEFKKYSSFSRYEIQNVWPSGEKKYTIVLLYVMLKNLITFDHPQKCKH
jgi:hypothetical protein